MSAFRFQFHCMRSFTVFVALSFVTVTAGAQAPAKSAQQQFEHGKQLIEKNCLDCINSAKKGMEDGIREVEAAMQAGFRDQIAANKLLSEAYGAMAVYSEQTDPKQSGDYWKKRADTMKKLYALDPDDPEIAESYVYTLSDDAEKTAILRTILRKHPDYNPASFLLGLMLIGSKNYSEGLRLEADAIAKEKGLEDGLNYIERLLSAFHEQGCPVADEAKWLEDAGLAFETDAKAAGEPTAFPLFKMKFLDVMKNFECRPSAETPQPAPAETGVQK